MVSMIEFVTTQIYLEYIATLEYHSFLKYLE